MFIITISDKYRFPFNSTERACCFTAQVVKQLDAHGIEFDIDKDGDIDVSDNKLPPHAVEKILEQFKIWSSNDIHASEIKDAVHSFIIPKENFQAFHPWGRDYNEFAEELAEKFCHYLHGELSEKRSPNAMSWTGTAFTGGYFLTIAAETSFLEDIVSVFDESYQTFLKLEGLIS